MYFSIEPTRAYQKTVRAKGWSCLATASPVDVEGLLGSVNHGGRALKQINWSGTVQRAGGGDHPESQAGSTAAGASSNLHQVVHHGTDRVPLPAYLEAGLPEAFGSFDG